MGKPTKFLWMLFGALVLGSLACVGYSLFVYHFTPLLVHDTLQGVEQLNDAQAQALYLALMKAYRPAVFGCATALLAWILFAVFALRWLRRCAH